jgi:hypothetical protein
VAKKVLKRRANGKAAEPALSSIDRDLRSLVRAAATYTTHGRTMLERGTDEQKLHAIELLKRIRLAWRGVRAEDGAPYRDARLLLTEGLIFYAGCERNIPSEDRALSRARELAQRVASYYPTLETKLIDPKRIELIRKAIVIKSKRTTMPWREVVAIWDGVEGVPRDADRWRKDWAEREKRP